MKELHRHLIYLLLILAGGTLFFHHQRTVGIREIKSQAIATVRKQLSASQSAFDKLSQNFYNDYNDYLSAVLSRSADRPDEWARLREELLDRLYPAYKSAALFGLSQFQIHTADGTSFLRFHFHRRHADPLLPVRPSLRRVLREKRFLKGFEAGRYVDGLRYIYPLFYDGRYVGSYEWVWSHESLVKELHRIYGEYYMILIRRDQMRNILVPETLKRNYTPLRHCTDFLYPNSALNLYTHSSRKLLEEILTDPTLCRHLLREHDYAEAIGSDRLLVTVPVRNLAASPYGVVVALLHEERIAERDSHFWFELLLLATVLILLAVLLYRSYRDKMFVRTLLDSQKDIVILTDGVRIKTANRTFLEFFDTHSVEEFARRHGCICNLFIRARGYLGKEYRGKNWIRHLLEGGERNRVILYDKKRDEKRIFMVSVNRFDRSGLYVVSFRDVTELEREKRHLEIESITDHPTRLYNKRAFEDTFKERLEEIRHCKLIRYGLIMFDIDHFKRINDRYGHRQGDEVLRALAALVRTRIRHGDFLARWGGEEFVILMESPDDRFPCAKADSLRRSIEESDFPTGEKITCSFGVTMLRPGDTPESALERVDRLLYRAKESGRNRVVCEE